MLGCKVVDNPIKQNKKLIENDESTLVDKGRYQWLVGKLMYLSHTRTDIAYAIMSEPIYAFATGISHGSSYRILYYLKSSPGKRLLFSWHDHL